MSLLVAFCGGFYSLCVPRTSGLIFTSSSRISNDAKKCVLVIKWYQNDAERRQKMQSRDLFIDRCGVYWSNQFVFTSPFIEALSTIGKNATVTTRLLNWFRELGIDCLIGRVFCTSNLTHESEGVKNAAYVMNSAIWYEPLTCTINSMMYSAVLEITQNYKYCLRILTLWDWMEFVVFIQVASLIMAQRTWLSSELQHDLLSWDSVLISWRDDLICLTEAKTSTKKTDRIHQERIPIVFL